jgi:thiamine-phosphate pyrophosphorylase
MENSVAVRLKSMNQPTSPDRHSIFRVLDANFNRATEAFRVLEEVTRFGISHSFLASELKSARHRLVTNFQPYATEMVLARDTQNDVGTDIQTESETTRRDLADVVGANCSRLKQSLRCLEEFGKAVDAALGTNVEQLRYQFYTLEKAIRNHRRVPAISQGQLYVLVDGDASELAFERRITQLVAAQVDIIQLRDKKLADRELLQRAKMLSRLTKETPVLSVINDRPDIAVLSHADGVHVGQDELTCEEVRRLVGDQLFIGISTHSIEQAREAVLSGADYIGVGPTFPSSTKSFTTFPGLQLLTEVAREIHLPAFAIGGISIDNLGSVLEAGISRVAIQAALQETDSLPSTVEQWKASLKSLQGCNQA